MSQLINDLARIEVSNDALQQLDMGNIYKDFSKNYKKLDDLKNFRSDYEQKNRLMRWWHNDKLRDAQLDSAEVQSEFSKTIGQLMMISILQSKKLAEQQTQLTGQQGDLKKQADGIAAHAATLQQQHGVLAEQSKKLETLVREYFDLKGLTEDGAQKLVAIAHEVKATKNDLLEEFVRRTSALDTLHGDILSLLAAMSAEVGDRLSAAEEQFRSALATQAEDIGRSLHASESKWQYEHEAAQMAVHQALSCLQGELQGELQQTAARQDAFDQELRQALRTSEAGLRDEQRAAQATVQQGLAGLKEELQAAAASQLAREQAFQQQMGAIEEAQAAQLARLSGATDELLSLRVELAGCRQRQTADQEHIARIEQGMADQIGKLKLGVAASVAGLVVLAGVSAHLLHLF